MRRLSEKRDEDDLSLTLLVGLLGELGRLHGEVLDADEIANFADNLESERR